MPRPPSRSKPGRPLRLRDFETRIRVRQLRTEDYDALVAMQRDCFPGMQTWSREQVESQLQVFPEGQLCVEYEGRLVASASSLVVDSDLYSDWHSWPEISDHGFIRNHDPEGDTLYGIEIMVHPEYRGLKLARRLYDARKELARRYNLARIVIGGRIPGYGAHADRLSAREYCEQVVRGKLYDPVLTTQTANGFVLKRLIPDYLPADDASRGYATYCEWNNLDHVEEPARRLVTTTMVRICAVQYEMRDVESFAEFARQCEFFVDVASEHKADFLLFPELVTTQLLSCHETKQPHAAARDLAEVTPQYLELFTGLAVRYNVNIVGGSQFLLEEGELYNVAYLFRRDGTLARQPKLHVTPSERRWWGLSPGARVEVFDTDRGRVAVLVGEDIEQPELARVVASRGAQVLFVPFNTDSREGYLRVRYCAQARCVECNVYAVVAGCVGNLPFVDHADVHYAQSAIFTPVDLSFPRDGVAAESSPNTETVVVRDVDLAALRRLRHAGVTAWSERRTDLYRVRYTPSGEDPVDV
jgi:predicted amidohydrolase/ribosomal protein S18 acetylase RimI-like enzyme